MESLQRVHLLSTLITGDVGEEGGGRGPEVENMGKEMGRETEDRVVNED